jgi:HEAT repeat protein
MADSHINQLVASLKDRSWGVRAESAEMLAAMGSAAADAVEPLCAALLGDSDWVVRRACASALGCIAPWGAERAVLALADALVGDSMLSVKRESFLSLAKFDSPPPETIPRLRELLESSSPLAREAARQLLDKLGAT